MSTAHTIANDVRQIRVDAMRDAAVTYRLLGQAATHRRAPDGQHVVTLYDRDAAQLRTWTGADLAEVLGRAGNKSP
jgi:predicted TPR repeat methyltransferase